MTFSKLSVVVGGQYGSEAKGAVAGYLASTQQNPDRWVLAVRVAGPNAGHTVYGNCPADCPDQAAHGVDTMGWADPDRTELPNGIPPGHPWRLRQVPVAAVTNGNCDLIIAAGSEIDPTVLRTELSQLDSAGYKASNRIVVDHQATVLEQQHIDEETAQHLHDRIGSTGKGIGAARVARLQREAATWGQWADRTDDQHLADLTRTDTASLLNRTLVGSSDHIVIEGTQGFALGLHAGHYPRCTTSDCRAIDFLSMAGVNPWLVDTANPSRFNVWVVLRTYPIRVAGNSGPMEGETSWDALGLPPERTTVTNKVRRVGEWDTALARRAIRANGGLRGNPVVKVALMMVDYRIPELYGHTFDTYHRVTASNDEVRAKFSNLMIQMGSELGVAPTLYGTSPQTLIDLRDQSGDAR